MNLLASPPPTTSALSAPLGSSNLATPRTGARPTGAAPSHVIRILDVANAKDVVGPTLINAYSAMTIPAYARAVNFLADNLASFPRSVRLDGAQQTDAAKRHPLNRLLRRRPNDYQNGFVFWRTWYMHAAHAGNAYAWIQRDRQFQPIALHNLIPADVVPFRWFPDERATTPLQCYYVRSTKVVLFAEDVLHLQGPSWDGQAGHDPAETYEQTFQRAATLDRYQTRYLQKGTVIRGTVEIPVGVPDTIATEIQNRIRQFYNGPEADRDVMVLGDGAKLNNNTLSPHDSQLTQQAQASTKQIAQITGVPPEFLYERGESKYNNSVEQAGQDVVRFTFRPWIDQAQDELTAKLLSESEQDEGYSVKLNPGALLRGSTKEQTETVAASVNAGIRTRNEARELLELPPDADPDSDKLKTLGDTTVNKPATPPPASPNPPATPPEG